MDYYSLTRKELQALCKKHAIPANVTNVSMAEALTALLGVDKNKPSDKGFQKQEPTSEDVVDESTITEISYTPKRNMRSKRQEAPAEGKTGGEPIVLKDDEVAAHALKEKHTKSASKTSGKSKPRGKEGKMITEDVPNKDKRLHVPGVHELPDAITPHPYVQMEKGRSCKSSKDARIPRTRNCRGNNSEDVKPVEEGEGSCDNEKESDEANCESAEEVPKARAQGRPSRKKVDVKPVEEGEVLCDNEKESDEANCELAEEVPKTGAKGRPPRKKVEEATKATSIHGAHYVNSEVVEEAPKTMTKVRSSRKKEEEVFEATEESTHRAHDVNSEAVEEAPKTRPKVRSSKKKEDGVLEAIEENIHGAHDVNSEAIEAPKTRPKVRYSRKKEDEVLEATGEGIHESNDNEAVEEAPKTRRRVRSSRKKEDEFVEATEESIHGLHDANSKSVEQAPKTRPKERWSSRKKEGEVVETTEEIIRGTQDASKVDVTPIYRRSTRSSRRKVSCVDSVKKTPDTSKMINSSCSGRLFARVEDSSYKEVEDDVTGRSSQKESTQVYDEDGMEETVGKVKTICTRRRRNPQKLHQLAESGSECRDEKQDRVDSESITMKYQGKDEYEKTTEEIGLPKESEQVEDAKEIESKEIMREIGIQQELEEIVLPEEPETVEDECKNIEEIALPEECEQVEDAKEVMREITIQQELEEIGLPEEPEQVDDAKEIELKGVMCETTVQQKSEISKNLDEKQIPSDFCQSESTIQVQNKSMLGISDHGSPETPDFPTSWKAKDYLPEEKMNADDTLTPSDDIMGSTQSGPQETKMPAGGEAYIIEVGESEENTFQEGVDLLDLKVDNNEGFPNDEYTFLGAEEGEYLGIEDEDVKEEAVASVIKSVYIDLNANSVPDDDEPKISFGDREEFDCSIILSSTSPKMVKRAADSADLLLTQNRLELQHTVIAEAEAAAETPEEECSDTEAEYEDEQKLVGEQTELQGSTNLVFHNSPLSIENVNEEMPRGLDNTEEEDQIPKDSEDSASRVISNVQEDAEQFHHDEVSLDEMQTSSTDGKRHSLVQESPIILSRETKGVVQELTTGSCNEEADPEKGAMASSAKTEKRVVLLSSAQDHTDNFSFQFGGKTGSKESPLVIFSKAKHIVVETEKIGTSFVDMDGTSVVYNNATDEKKLDGIAVNDESDEKKHVVHEEPFKTNSREEKYAENLEASKFVSKASSEDNKVPVSMEVTRFHNAAYCNSLQMEKENTHYGSPSLRQLKKALMKKKAEKMEKENTHYGSLSLRQLKALVKKKAEKVGERVALKMLSTNKSGEREKGRQSGQIM